MYLIMGSWCLDDGSNVFDMGFLYLIMVLTYWTMDLIMMVLNNLIVLLILVFWFQDQIIALESQNCFLYIVFILFLCVLDMR